MSLDELAELDAVIADMDEREDERFKFVGECIARALGAKVGGGR